MTVILSADPGITGALALRETAGRHASRLISVDDMPFFERKIAGVKTLRKTLDEAAVVRFFQSARLIHGASLFVMERVNGLPGQSGPGAFTFGYGAGVLTTAARCLEYRIETVQSAIWKRDLRVPADKNAARLRACELMPESAHLWPLKKDADRAEAAMIGLYAERNLL